MRFRKTAFSEIVIVEAEPIEDHRGSFERVWANDELAALGFAEHAAQISLSRNRIAGTVRGLHFAAAPFSETKFVRCMRGRLLDFIVDVRPSSATFAKVVTIELDADGGLGIRIPPGFAHGFQTLEDHTHVMYVIDRAFRKDAARSINIADPRIGISLPLPISEISDRDQAAPGIEAVCMTSTR